ncbi:RIP metalloprotease RseP [Chloroflexota bacterium]
MVVNIIIGVVALSVIVLVHELGHFFTARITGVKIEEFGLGYPPKLFGIKRGETVYSLNAIPFGGFIKLSGEEDPSAPRSFASKGIGVRLLILSAGSLMNILLPFFLLTAAFVIPHDAVVSRVVVEKVVSDSPAAMAGMRPGDEILSIDGNPVNNISDLQRYIQLNLGVEITVLVERGESITDEMQLVPRWKPPEGQGATGIAVRMLEVSVVKQQHSLWDAMVMGVGEFGETFVLYKNGIISLIIGAAPAIVAGPVGIAEITGEVARAGISPLLEFIALISLILGVVNLFPIPALDGGRITFVILEWIRRGRRVSPKTEGLVHTIGFVLLITAMLLVTYQDIVRIISGQSLMP